MIYRDEWGEIKPNTKWGRIAGKHQMDRYIKAAKENFPNVKEWVPELYFYESTKAVGLFYTIQEGDNLSKFSEKFSISIKDISSINKIENKDKIYAGNKLLIDIVKLVPTETTEINNSKSDATNVNQVDEVSLLKNK